MLTITTLAIVAAAEIALADSMTPNPIPAPIGRERANACDSVDPAAALAAAERARE
jgi:hypothetical protein